MSNFAVFDQYSGRILSHAGTGFDGEPLPRDLLIKEDGQISIYYAPFDYVNANAKLVIVGITPGLVQAKLALNSVASDLLAGTATEESLRNAKSHASFGGPMRTNLINMLDHLDLNKLLGICSAADLFTSASRLVQFTSVLRYPVFVSGKNYSGSPQPNKVSLLENAISYFQSEVQVLRNALFVPVGKLPNDILGRLVKSGDIPATNVLFDIPHPSGANQERVNYFLGKKRRNTLSSKTNPDKLDMAEKALLAKLMILKENKF